MKVQNMIFSVGMSTMLLFGVASVQAVQANQPTKGDQVPSHHHGKCPHSHIALIVGPQLMDVLKMDTKTFHAELEKGKSILQIAQERGVKKQVLINMIVKEMSAKVDEQVKSGNMTKEKAEWVKKYLPVRAEMFLTKPGHKCPKQRENMVE